MLLLLVSLNLFSCEKSGSRNVNFELTVTDKQTGAPVKASVFIRYEQTPASLKYSSASLGMTDASGRLTVKRDFPDQLYNAELLISGAGNYGFPGVNFPDYGLKIQATKSKKIYHVQLAPYYYGTLHLKNMNCLDETDSVWVSNDQTSSIYSADGCADTIIPSVFFSFEPTVVTTIHVKRNGNTTQSSQTFQHQHNLISDFWIEY